MIMSQKKILRPYTTWIIRQILYQFKSITLGCEKVNVKNILVAYVCCFTQCCNTPTRFSDKNLRMMEHLSWLGARKKSRGVSAAKI